ncbi:MAG: hypothetical protein IKQ80_12770 [Clostridia bacterium]|nr:hypothetical protein [Clostridia bacterium]
MIDLKIPNPLRAGKAKPRARKAKKGDRSTLKTALWLLLPPVGLMMMWRPACRWHVAVKASVTVAMAAALIAVFAIPGPSTPANGGVSLVSSRPEVEVYGPDLPNFIVPGYTNDQTESVIMPAEENDVHYVYAADGARCYHEYKCKFAFASSQRLTVYEAYFLGFEPCNRCKPPIYDPTTNTITMQEHDDKYDPS